MKLNIIHSIALALSALTLPFLTACTSQDTPAPPAPQDLNAVFILDLEDAAPELSRSTPNDGEYSKGSALENYIDIPGRDFRCHLFGKDNTFISTLEVVTIFKLGEAKRYSIRARVKDTDDVKNALKQGCRFVFLANWGTYVDPVPSETTIASLCDATFNFSQSKTQLSDSNPKNLIPMYGVKEFENGVPDFIEDKITSDIGTIHLLRAYAKIDVTVKFVDFEDTPQVESVSLTHSNDKGFKAPANVTKESDYVHGSWFTDYTPVNIPTDAKDIELSLTKDEAPESGWHYVAYVPEYRNTNEAGQPLDSRSAINISFNIGENKLGGSVEFKYSDSYQTEILRGKHFDIARNNCYKYDIVIKGKDIDWTVDVIPFSSVELDLDYGMLRDEFTGYVVGKDIVGNKCWYDRWGDRYYLGLDDNGDFVTINGVKYLLVYADYEYPGAPNKIMPGYERNPLNLHHFFEEKTGKKYFMTPEGITGYKPIIGDMWGVDRYFNKSGKLVWIDTCGDPNPEIDPNGYYDKLKKKGLELNCCRVVYEWERSEWDQAIYWEGVVSYPRFWFDVLGNRHPWSKETTKDYIKTYLGDWVQYLE